MRKNDIIKIDTGIFRVLTIDGDKGLPLFSVFLHIFLRYHNSVPNWSQLAGDEYLLASNACFFFDVRVR